MIKASYLQKHAGKYRELARAELSLEMRRQLFALAARCDELAAMMARWPGPKDLKQTREPALVPPVQANYNVTPPSAIKQVPVV